jgi:hypothetical protein
MISLSFGSQPDAVNSSAKYFCSALIAMNAPGEAPDSDGKVARGQGRAIKFL